jgi:hypothetical protein
MGKIWIEYGYSGLNRQSKKKRDLKLSPSLYVDI